MRYSRHTLLNAMLLWVAPALGPAEAGHDGSEAPAALRWAGDAEDGAPFVEADPGQPDQVVGFDVEVAGLIARALGRAPRFVMVTFTSLDQSIERGDADIALSGIEDTPARRAALAPTIPYHEFREVLSVRDADASLRDAINEILLGAMRDGSLERIFRKWQVWSADQPAMYAQLLAREPVAPVIGLDASASVPTMTRWDAAVRYLPSLLRASVVTIVLSCLSMGLAVVLGVLIATGRLYGGRPLRGLLTGYVELMRGTPILLQLFVLYYGIATAIRLPAFAAALLGLALNDAAYESEIYRAALDAISPGQLEAARTLGLSERQVRTLVRELSGGEAQRVAIARALAVDPPLLLMDEPTASLDPARRTELGELLRGLLRQGRTLIVATHDEEFAREFATRVLRLRDGMVAGR